MVPKHLDILDLQWMGTMGTDILIFKAFGYEGDKAWLKATDDYANTILPRTISNCIKVTYHLIMWQNELGEMQSQL